MSGLFILADPNVQLVLEDGRASVVACSKAWMRVARENLSCPPGVDHWPYLWFEVHPEPNREPIAVARIHVPIPKTEGADEIRRKGMWDVRGNDVTFTVARHDPCGSGSWIETATISFSDGFSCMFAPTSDHPAKVYLIAEVWGFHWGERCVQVESMIETGIGVSGYAEKIRISFFAPSVSEAVLRVDAPRRLSAERLLVVLGHGDSKKDWPAILFVPASEWVRRTFWVAWDSAGEVNG